MHVRLCCVQIPENWGLQGDFSKIHHLVKGDNYRKVFQETGNLEDGVWSAGIVMGLIDDVPTCDALLTRIVAEAESIMTHRLPNMIVPE